MDKDGVVIIGAGGIGMAITRRISTGRAVLLADCNETALKALAQQMRGEGHQVSTRVTDVADRDAVAARATAAAGLGRVTHVVHTAGVSPVQAPTERVLHVDLLGTALVLEECGRVIAPGGAGVVISSMAGHMAGGYPSDIEHALAATPTSELLALPSWQPTRWVTPVLPPRWPSGAIRCECRQRLLPGGRAAPASTASAPRRWTRRNGSNCL